MAEFCTCGSIIINGHCTNKSCANKSAAKHTASNSLTQGKKSAEKKEAKSTRTRRSSKCITYNLNDIQEQEEGIS